MSTEPPPAGQNDGMNRPVGGNGGAARSVGMDAVKGAVLIGLAVIVGVFLLQHVDSSRAGSVAGPTSSSTKPKTTTTVRGTESTTTTTTVPSAPPKPTDQLRVVVLNGSGISGRARDMRTQLLGQRYTNEDPASTWSGHIQTGTTVMCKPGLIRDATALAVAVGKGTPVPVVTYSTALPSFATSADCVVVVGR